MIMIKTQEKSKEHEAKWGGYNDFPSGWTKITIKELVQNTQFDHYNPILIEHRQMLPTSGKKRTVVPAKLFFYHDGTGVGIVCDYWKGTVTFYRFGCKHEYKEISQEECQKRGVYHGGGCYHVSVCTKCEQVNAVDSSD